MSFNHTVINAYENIRSNLRNTTAAQTSEYIEACRSCRLSRREVKKPPSAYSLFCANKDAKTAAAAIAGDQSLGEVARQLTLLWQKCPKDIMRAFEKHASQADDAHQDALHRCEW